MKATGRPGRGPGAAARLAMNAAQDDPAAARARQLLKRGQSLQAELRGLCRKFLPKVLGQVKRAHDLSAEAGVSAELRHVALACLDLVASERDDWRLRVGAGAEGALVAARDWALLELHAIGERHRTELLALRTREAKTGTLRAIPRRGTEGTRTSAPSLAPKTVQAQHQCAIHVG